MPVSLPFQITAGTLADATQVQACLQALADKFTANVVDGDIASGANIQGSKLADGTVPAAKIVPGSITSTQVAALGLGAGLYAAGAINGATDLLAASIPDSKAKVTITFASYTNATLPTGATKVTLNPSSNFAIASYDLVGFYLTPAGGTPVANPNFFWSTLATDVSPNWGGVLVLNNQTGGTINVTFRLYYVFWSKT